MYLNVGECGNYLVLGWEFGALLELEVANGSRQCEIAVNATKINEATCGLDSCFLS